MFDKFGEFDTAEELNRSAKGLKDEGDIESLKILAEENGFSEFDVEDYCTGAMSELCTAVTAALGKLAVEKEDLKPSEVVGDWISYIESEVMEDESLARAVKKKDKSIIGCIGAILKWSYTNMYKVDKRIIEAAGIKGGPSEIKMGVPGMATAKDLIRGYYCG